MQELTPYLNVVGPPAGAALAALAAWLKAKPSKSQMDRIEATLMTIQRDGTETRRQINQVAHDTAQDIQDVRDALQGHAERADAHSNRFTRRRARTQLGAQSGGPTRLPVLRPHAPGGPSGS